VATSHSKDLALPGERIGYIAIHPDCPDKQEIIDGMVFCNRTLGFVNAPALAQHLVTSLQSVTVDVGLYERKRNFLYSKLTDMGYSVVRPQGAFYMFPKAPIDDDVEFVDKLKEERVLAVPGTGFGLPGYFRLSYCLKDETIEGALPGLSKAISQYS
jgi:aspartate aminotransferase